MPRAFSSTAVALLLSTLTLATSASGETILIRRGGVGFDPGDPPGLTLGGDGFSLMTHFPSIASSGVLTCVPRGCEAGTLASLSTVFGGDPANGEVSLGGGTASIGDRTYTSSAVRFLGTLFFDAPTLPIPDGGLSVRLSAPFLLRGSIAGVPRQLGTGPVFEVDLVGQGLATLALRRDAEDPSGLYRFQGVQYTFHDPVPEPATLVLFGSGLAGLLVRRRARNLPRRATLSIDRVSGREPR